MRSKDIERQKQKLKLTRRQRDILVGLLLGDGHLETQNNGRTYRLKVEHAEKQRDYVKWLYDEFKEWVPSGIYEKERPDGSKTVGFTTYSHGSFRFYGHQFYESGVKRIPKLIHKLLSPVGIAVWFMDDGSRKSLRHKTFIIHTLGYTKKDLERLQEALQKKSKIITRLHRQKQKYWRLYILSESAQQFLDLVQQYVKPIRSMRHKLIE